MPAQSSDTQMKQANRKEEVEGLGWGVRDVHRCQLSLMEIRASVTGSRRRDRGWVAHGQIIGLCGVRRIMNLRVNA